jgi:hypothetical protein
MQTAGARKPREDEYVTSRQGRRFERSAHAADPLEQPPAERRTVIITGQPVAARRRRSAAQQQLAARPDRVALWAFLLGVFLVLVAAATANAAVL